MAKVSRQKGVSYGSLAGWEGFPYHLPDKPLPVGRVSYEEFLDWADEDTLAEWVDGEIIMASPCSYDHQNIKGFLETVMRTYVEAFNLGVVVSAGFQMKLSRSGREPDVIFIATEHLSWIKRTFLEGPGDLAVEIVSPESQERDRETKFEEYARDDVPEYWLIDPTQREAMFYQLDDQKQYQPVPLDAEGKYHSRSLKGFWLRPEWLWQEHLPAVEKTLLAIGGSAYALYLIEQLKVDGFLPPTT